MNILGVIFIDKQTSSSYNIYTDSYSLPNFVIFLRVLL